MECLLKTLCSNLCLLAPPERVERSRPGPEVKIKNLINEENILSFLHTERERERESSSQGHQWEDPSLCLETINIQQVMPRDRDRMSRMIALEMFAVNIEQPGQEAIPFITFLSKFGKTNNQTKTGNLWRSL